MFKGIKRRLKVEFGFGMSEIDKEIVKHYAKKTGFSKRVVRRLRSKSLWDILEEVVPHEERMEFAKAGLYPDMENNRNLYLTTLRLTNPDYGLSNSRIKEIVDGNPELKEWYKVNVSDSWEINYLGLVNSNDSRNFLRELCRQQLIEEQKGASNRYH